MLTFGNKTNIEYYLNLMKNPLLCDKSNCEIDKYILNNRELIAIVDLLIAYDSISFVGSHISSFSRMVKNKLMYNNNNNIKLFIL